MQSITPIEITEDMLVSPIAEPDSSVGEVEWVDPKLPVLANTITSGGNYFASAVATNGYTYFGGDAIARLSQSGVAEYVAELTGTARCAVSLGSYVYFGTLSGQIYRLTTSTKAVTQITVSGSSSLYSAINIGDGFLYFGASGKVVSLQISNGVTRVYEVGSGIFQSVVRGFDGLLYFSTYSSSSSTIYRFDTEELTGVEVMKIDGGYRCSTIGDNGLIYMIGSAGNVAVVNISSLTVSYFGSTNTVIFGSSSMIDGVFLACGRSETSNGVVVSVNTNNSTIELLYTEPTLSDTIRAMSINNGKYHLCFANSQLFRMTQSYGSGEQVILSSNHKVYQSVTRNNDNPVTGSQLISPSWVELYSTNRFRMFDYVITTASTGIGNLLITPGQSATTISFFGLENVANIQVIYRYDDTNAEILSNKAKSTILASPIDDQIVSGTLYSDKLIFEDLSTYEDPYISIVITGADTSKDWSIGSIVLGNARKL